MSLITAEYHLSVKPFAAVPALLNLPEIICGPATVSNISCFSSMRSSSVNLKEGCLTTKSMKYAHQLAHIVMLEFSNLASEPVLTCCGCSYQNCCYKQGQPRSFSSCFGHIQGGNLVATGCNGNSGAIGANFGLKNGKIDKFWRLGLVGMPIQCRPNFGWLWQKK